MPRVPDPLNGIEVTSFFTLIPDGKGLSRARINYRYEKNKSFVLSSDRALPSLSVRLGPYSNSEMAEKVQGSLNVPDGAKLRIESSGHYRCQKAWWLWIENMRDITEITLNAVAVR